MAILTVKELEDTLGKLVAEGKKPEKILLGYKAYGELMNDRSFLRKWLARQWIQTNENIKILKLRLPKTNTSLK